jgi:hypothetical protein
MVAQLQDKLERSNPCSKLWSEVQSLANRTSHNILEKVLCVPAEGVFARHSLLKLLNAKVLSALVGGAQHGQCYPDHQASEKKTTSGNKALPNLLHGRAGLAH